MAIEQALIELERIIGCIRKHRDQKFDDRCWLDDIELYKETLPEGVGEADLRLLSPCEMMANCVKYIQHRHDPNVPYVSSQREIERLEARVKELEKEVLEEFYRGRKSGYRSGYRDASDGAPFDGEMEE